VLGDDVDLFALFDLPFYLLHEYVSHAFARWDDRHLRLSEAYLLRAAFAYLRSAWRDAEPARLEFLGAGFERRRLKTDPHSLSDLRRAEDCFHHLHDRLGPTFMRFLLDWATIPVHEDSDRNERQLALSALHALARKPNLRETVFGPPPDGDGASEILPVEVISERLYAVARELRDNYKA
jgi:hypothetical protein